MEVGLSATTTGDSEGASVSDATRGLWGDLGNFHELSLVLPPSGPDCGNTRGVGTLDFCLLESVLSC